MFLPATERRQKNFTTYFSQVYWYKSVWYLTYPNFFGICQEIVGICHKKLGEVIFIPMPESTQKFL